MERPQLTAGVAAAALCSAALAGCGLSNPYQGKPTAAPAASPTTSTSTSTPTSTTTAATGTLPTTNPSNLDADPPGERDGTIPAAIKAAENRVGPGSGSPTAAAAVNRYARLYINWTAATLKRDQLKLAALSIGAARLQAQQAAATGATNPQLKRDHVSNTGQVVSISPGRGPAPGQWVIVTSETTGGKREYHGLPAEVHVTYAQVTHTRQGWVISEWMPQT